MRKIAVGSVVVAAGIVSWLGWRQSRSTPFVVSGFVEADQIRVGSRVGGRVAAVHITEGERVEVGRRLFELEPFDLRSRLARATAGAAAAKAEWDRLRAGFRREEIEEARARRDLAAAALARLVSGPRAQEIEIARQHLNEARANLEWAEAENERLTKLREEDVAALRELRDTVRFLKTSQAGVAAAEQRLDLLEEGTRKEEIAEATAQLAATEQVFRKLEAGFRIEEIAAAEARLEAARAETAAIEAQLAELTVSSPCDCLIEATDLRPGDLVSPNAPSVALLDLSRLWVRAYVPENRLGQVRIGDTVSVRVDSFHDRLFDGRVTFLSSEAEFTPQNVQTPEERSKQVFRIKVAIDEGKQDLRVGMWADVLMDRTEAR